jgi:hypothetical protein
MAVYCKNHIEHINKLCEKNANDLVLKLPVFIETIGGVP